MTSDATPEATASPLTKDERNWGMLAHLLTFLGYLAGIAHFVPPLVIYLVKGDDSPFIADQARESLNFQITVILAGILGAVLCFTGVFLCVGIPYLVLLFISHFVFVIVAAIHAKDGKRYRYPCAVRVV